VNEKNDAHAKHDGQAIGEWGRRFSITGGLGEIEIQDGDNEHAGLLWICIEDEDGDVSRMYLSKRQWHALDAAARKVFAYMTDRGDDPNVEPVPAFGPEQGG
jgi:hypothetical protein